MPTISVRIPQIGEGLQEARLVAVLKQPGDKVRRDEPIYQMETDKAVMDVESPYEGTLVEWLAPVDTILPIGGEVARMAVEEGVQETGGHAPAAGAPAAGQSRSEGEAAVGAGGARLQGIPPRTRAYAKEKGISDADLLSITASGTRLMPADLDAYLTSRSSTPEPSRPTAGAKSVGGAFEETPVSSTQRVLNSRMVRGNALVVPGTEMVTVNWEPIEKLRAEIKANGNDFQPSAFTIFSYCVAQVVNDFPGFRTSIVGDDTYRTYRNCSLGIAVSLPGDELVLAVVEESGALAWREFAARMRERIDLARGGKDQANEAVTLSLTNMQAFGLRDAVPVAVPPSVATLFLGAPFNGLDQNATELRLQRQCNLSLTFDHRVVNGVGAAHFLSAIREKVETVGTFITRD